MTAQCEASDLYRNSMDVNCILDPITNSPFVEESASISASDSTNTSGVSIAQTVNKPKLGTYLIDRTIGKGIFSVVKLATHTITGINLAIKIIDKTRLDAENLVKIYRESEILKKLHHPNIVKLFQIMETPRLLYIAMEFLPNGEVFDYIANHGRFSEPIARVKFMDVLHAVDYIHSMGIVHRDIKAENLLFDAQMNIKLTDFSFGTHYSASDSQPLLTTWCGSPPYAAPEIFKGEPYIGTKADIWSLGVVLYVMVCGTLPFDAQPLPHLKNQVLSASFRVPYWLSLTCERLIRSMLCKQPVKRPTTQEIMQHPWFSIATTTTRPMDTVSTKPTSMILCSDSVDLVQTACTSAINIDCSSSKPDSRFDRPFASVTSTSSSLAASGHSPSMVHTEQSWRHMSPLEKSNPMMSRSEPELGNPDELVLLIMESLGMNRSQILSSLDRRAYDHLMATYLLLGEKLRYHRHSFSFGSPDFNQFDSHPKSQCEDNFATVRAMEIEEHTHCRTQTKHSRVDSAVDIKSSISEVELHEDAAMLSTSLLDAKRNHGINYIESRSIESEKWHPVSLQHRYSTPVTTNGTTITNFTESHMVTNTICGNSVQQQQQCHSCTNEPIFHSPYQNQGTLRCQVTSIHLPVNATHYCPHISNHYHDPEFYPSHHSADVGYQSPSIPHGLAHATDSVSDVVEVGCGADSTIQSINIPTSTYGPVTNSNGLCDNQSNLPWFIHNESVNQTFASPVKRKTLVRRKYGVFNPPEYLDQLAQAMLVEHSSVVADPVSDMSQAIDEGQH